MSRAKALFGVGIAALCGIATSYATFQPEFEKQQAERTGEFQAEHKQGYGAISKEIISDMKEAEHQIVGDGKGIAWGIREAIWGKPEDRRQTVLAKANGQAEKGQQAKS